MKKNHLHKKFIQFLLERHTSQKSGCSNDMEDEKNIEPDEVISQLLEEYEKVKSEYEDLLKR